MRIKEQTRKLAAGCQNTVLRLQMDSKHCFEVVDRTDAKHCFEVVDGS
ncbi:hypothetical protein [Streptococcus pneumoniae]|nr:hypothetical protein [Streptococcus pneumoniae]